MEWVSEYLTSNSPVSDYSSRLFIVQYYTSTRLFCEECVVYTVRYSQFRITIYL